MATTHKTVSAAWCNQAARELMQSAEDNLAAWVLLGTTDRYEKQMHEAAILERAAKLKSVAERREFLRGHGIDA